MNDGVVANSEIADLETSLLIGGGQPPCAANIRRPHAPGEDSGSHAGRPCVDDNLPTFG